MRREEEKDREVGGETKSEKRQREMRWKTGRRDKERGTTSEERGTTKVKGEEREQKERKNTQNVPYCILDSIPVITIT